jgi:uncharacterized protein
LFLVVSTSLAQDASKAATPAKAEATRWVSLAIGKHKLQAELAQTEAERSRGLMFRESLGKDQGMVFVFDEPGYHSMWMQNTLIPLSVAFIDASGKIINIRDMQPKSQDLHSAEGPAQYALEMTVRWFSDRGIKAGDVVSGLPPLTRKK